MPPRIRVGNALPRKVPDNVRKEHNDYHWNYRRANNSDSEERPGLPLERKAINLQLLPGVVKDESLSAFYDEENDGLERYVSFYNKLPKESEERVVDPDKEISKWKTAKQLAKDMYTMETGLHFCKILGAGGMGIVSVFVSYDASQSPTFWTVKRDIKGYQEVFKEKKTTLVSAPIILGTRRVFTNL